MEQGGGGGIGKEEFFFQSNTGRSTFLGELCWVGVPVKDFVHKKGISKEGGGRKELWMEV